MFSLCLANPPALKHSHLSKKWILVLHKRVKQDLWTAAKCVISLSVVVATFFLPWTSFTVNESEMKKEINDLRASEVKKKLCRVHRVRYFITRFFPFILPCLTSRALRCMDALRKKYPLTIWFDHFLLFPLCKVFMSIDYWLIDVCNAVWWFVTWCINQPVWSVAFKLCIKYKLWNFNDDPIGYKIMFVWKENRDFFTCCAVFYECDKHHISETSLPTEF